MINIPIGGLTSEISRVNRVHAIYRHACPNCGGSISDLRLLLKAPCEKCLPTDRLEEILSSASGKGDKLELLKKYLESSTREGSLRKLLEEELALKHFEEFFEKASGGYKMWSAQRTWARRLIRGESFSIIAPTGMGKTVFSLVATLFKAAEEKSKGRKVYLVFPTAPLLLQAWKKLLAFASSAGVDICVDQNWGDKCLRAVCVHGKLSRKQREMYLSKLRDGDFDVLMTTSAFLHKHGNTLPKGVYSLLVMDDVDAVLRSGKAVRRLLNLIGLTDELIDKGLELIRLKARMRSLLREDAEKLKGRLAELEESIRKAKESLYSVSLIVNSATGRPRGIYHKLFGVFLGFEAGSKPEAIRNIIDSYIIPRSGNLEDTLSEVVKKLRDGILIFVPVDRGIEHAEHIAETLKKQGLRVEAFHAKKQVDLIEKFARAELDALVGVATYYGIMVRGLDLPEAVKYVVFAGVPRHKFSSRLENVSPLDLLRMLITVRDVLVHEEKNEVDLLIGRISTRLRMMSQGALLAVRERLVEAIGKGSAEGETQLIVDLYRAYKILERALSMRDVIERLRKLDSIAIVEENGELYVLIPDISTYIQASGRCSRLYPGGITKGLSIVIVDDERLLSGLARRLRWIFEGFKFSKLEDLNLEEIIEEIEDQRDAVKKILRGELKLRAQLELIKTALLVVESPNKARTIANFFGKPSVRIIDGLKTYEIAIGNYIISIVASGGHVYELIVDPSKPPEAENSAYLHGILVSGAGDSGEFIPIYTDIKKCPNGHQFTDDGLSKCPKCQSELTSLNRKISAIYALRRLAREVDVVLIGTDPDSEGEKIAWDIRVLIEPYAEKVQRVEFHEVTRRAVLNAILNPRDFYVGLVEAQIVRRIEDRWLGFSLSNVLQKFAWPKYCVDYLYSKGKIDDVRSCCEPNRNLSAGRVQTPVLGYIIDEYNKSKDPGKASYILTVELEDGAKLSVAVDYSVVEKLNATNEKRGKIKEYPKVAITALDQWEEEVQPPPPFTTDSLLEEASRRLGFYATKTMELAQNLFEMGFITYHRTDSLRISDIGVEVAKQYLEEKYGHHRLADFFKSRTWSDRGAHEAIRPTRPIDSDHLAELVKEGALVVSGRLTRDHLKLYDLIFRRFIASQMKPARVRKQKFRLEIIVDNAKHAVEREILCETIERGFLDMYETFQPQIIRLGEVGSIKTGYVVGIKKIKYPLPKIHDVVKWMKEKGIGRPSTYAKVIQTVIDRRYAIVSKRYKALVVLEKGIFVHSFLTRFFGDRLSVETTGKLEELMDQVEQGRRDYQSILRELYSEVTESVINREEEIRKTVEGELRATLSNLGEPSPSLDIAKCIEGLSK
ncbi:MAG: reverse gyrase [Desulfurococcaceae archaeon]